MSELSKIKINVSSGEIDIQGNAEFVEKHLATIGSLFKEIQSHQVEEPPPTKKKNIETEASSEKNNPSTTEIPESFGEWFQAFPAKIKDSDKLLIGAAYVQKTSAGKVFNTLEPGKILTDHGIKVTNPAQVLKRAAKRKLIFQVKKDGTAVFYRLAKTGEDRLTKLKAEGSPK